MMSQVPHDSPLIFITGSTGFLGFRVLRHALESGYRVRAAVRSEAKAEILRAHKLLKSYDNKALSFVSVPDFLAPGAFDHVLRDVKYIIHCASPLPSSAATDVETFFIKPAVQGTMTLLNAANQPGSLVERVVITSSNAALLPTDYFQDSPKYADLAVDATFRNPYPTGPYDNLALGYRISKTAALFKAEEFVREQGPTFDIIHLCPSFIFGRDDLKVTLEDFDAGTNRIPLNLARGKPQVSSFRWGWNHVDDAARIHIEALDPRVKGNQAFLVNRDDGAERSWDDVQEIVARNFPEAVKDGRLPNDATYETTRIKTDEKKTIDTFGPLKTFEEAVVGIVGHYLEVLQQEDGVDHS